MRAMSITITSYPDEENLVAELWHDLENWGYVIYDDTLTDFLLFLYPPAAKGHYTFRFAAVQEVLIQAKRRLTEMGYGAEE